MKTFSLDRLKMAETQAENSEMNIQRLNIRYKREGNLEAKSIRMYIFKSLSNFFKHDVRIDQIEDELIHEKLKIKKISDDVDGTFKQMESGVVVV